MRVFVAGASGAVGRPLVRQLVAAGNQVTGISRRPERAEGMRASGAGAVVCDVFDAPALREAVARAAPEVVINQLTSLPQRYDPRRASFFEATNRVRGEGGRNLIEAAAEAGARRFISQSIAFLYAPEGDWVQDERGRTLENTPGLFGESVRVLRSHEREVVESRAFEGLVLRYGQFYGRGTYFARDGHIGREVRRRRFPIIGEGSGTFSFIHVEDAAGAAIAALEGGAPGLYNIADDEPTPMREWLPVYAEILGARPPLRLPAWLVRLLAGKGVTANALEMRGASNAKAKRDLGWEPRYSSWRQGFREALG